MGRKQRQAKQQVGTLEPAMVLALMSGIQSADGQDARAWGIAGRWALVFADIDHLAGRGPEPLAAAWEVHGGELTELAAEYGFRPRFVADDWTPVEREAEQRWRDEYLSEHGME